MYDPVEEFLSQPRSEDEQRAMLKWLEGLRWYHGRKDLRVVFLEPCSPARAEAARAYLRKVLG